MLQDRSYEMLTLNGQWVGTISGTNSGDVLLDISDDTGTLRGSIEVNDERLGLSAFDLRGLREADKFQIQLSPRVTQPGTVITPGSVSGTFEASDAIQGIWETELDTAGKFTASRVAAMSSSPSKNPSMPKSPPSDKSTVTPLWIIGGFLSLTEIVAGIVATQVSGIVQYFLTAFVILFPSSIAFAFFKILWNRPGALYPPTEYGPNTSPSEFAQAFGGAAPSQGEAQQRWLIGASEKTPASTVTASAGSDTTPKKEDELARDVIKYFAFKRMRYTDVSSPDSRALFNQGVDYGFHLFDGPEEVAFLGYFYQLDLSDIVARTRFLLNNIETSYVRVRQSEDLKQKEIALKLLDHISIIVLVPEGSDTTTIMEKIKEYRPDGSNVPVTFLRPSEIKKSVQQEYENMGLGK